MRRLSFLDRFLTLWIFLAMATGVGALVAMFTLGFVAAACTEEGAETGSSSSAGPSVSAGTGGTTDTSATAVNANGVPRLVDLGSVGCVPCDLMAVELETMSKQYSGAVELIFIDINKVQGAAKQYGIRVIPTQIFFDPAGNELYRHEGYMSKEDIVARFEDLGFPLQRSGPAK